MSKSLRIRVKGIVQGVGFRPFIYRIARDYALKGWVKNDTAGVEVVVSGDNGAVDAFLLSLREDHPPQAVIEELTFEEIEGVDGDDFRICPSGLDGKREVLVSPDLATCADCVRELFDPEDRRYRYPFINCTNCGPRFTIIKETPYDRSSTSMSVFKMCADCEREYNDPLDRRYHAQANACPVCGPCLWMVDADGIMVSGDPIINAARFIREGSIIAIKGLGGFHLACDATSDEAVFSLRQRKRRYEKPFAVMVRDVEMARYFCELGEEEERLLLSPSAQIVLLEEKGLTEISRQVVGKLKQQGLFLPYTPVHHLLMHELDIPLVMTSGNVSSEPIVKGNDEALAKLSGIADFFLLHDRDIVVRYDDSVTLFFAGGAYPVRRSRGYAPYPLRVNRQGGKEVLAVGADLKNTFCLLREGQAFVSQHIGDMESAEEVEHFREALDSMIRLFSLKPEIVAHDLHPEYVTTRLASEMGMPKVPVQHHHAHVVSCAVDNGITGKVLGIAFDGTGYGEDGTVWGGEFLLADELGYERLAGLYPYPMPGGDACIYRIYRMLFGVLFETLGDCRAAADRLSSFARVPAQEIEAMIFQVEGRHNTPLTSGAGRLFDAVAVLTGLRDRASHDAQAAMELEAIALDGEQGYDFDIRSSGGMLVVDTRPIFAAILEDIEKGCRAPLIAGRFHETMSRIIATMTIRLASITGVRRVVFSGGVFQNMKLARMVVEKLHSQNLELFFHRRVPCNDGGISLGQAVIAASRVSCSGE